jgi:hypothetical protein
VKLHHLIKVVKTKDRYKFLLEMPMSVDIATQRTLESIGDEPALVESYLSLHNIPH